MTYVQIDDSIYDHPKYADLELEHIGLIVCGVTYCNRHLTDGFVPAAVVRRFGSSGKGTRYVAALVAKGLWREVDGGYEIVGYLDHNAPREEVLRRRAELSAKRAAAGRKGGHVSGKTRSNPVEANEANGKQPTKQTLKQLASPLLKQNEAVSTSTTRSDQEIPPLVPPRGGTNQKTKQPKKPRPESASPCPPSDASEGDLAAWRDRWGIPSPRDEPDVAQFIDHHRARGNTFRDWAAAWRTWKRNAARFRDPPSGVFPRGRDLVQPRLDEPLWKVGE